MPFAAALLDNIDIIASKVSAPDRYFKVGLNSYKLVSIEPVMAKNAGKGPNLGALTSLQRKMPQL
jgi:hypothetical protein